MRNKFFGISLLLLNCIYLSTNAQLSNYEWGIIELDKTQRNDLKVKIDNEGFIFYGGTYYNGNNDKILVTKIHPNKDTIYQIRVNANVQENDYLNALFTDYHKNVLIAGSTDGEGPSQQALIQKFRSNGLQVFSSNFQINNNPTIGQFIVSDSALNIYACGKFSENDTAKYFVRKYDSSGTVLWTYLSANYYNVDLVGFKILSNLNLIVAYNNLTDTGNFGGFTCLKNAGIELYNKNFNALGLASVYLNNITIDDNANFYTIGADYSNENKDYFTAKWLANGKLRWYANFDQSGMDDEAIDATVIGSNVYVSGYATKDAAYQPNKDIVTINYSNAGIQIWKHQFSGRNNSEDIALKVLQNGSANFVVAANLISAEEVNTAAILNYKTDGSLDWQNYLPDTISESEIINDFDIDFLGNIYLAVNLNIEENASLFIKYNQPPRYIPVIKNLTKLLATGLLDAVNDSVIRFLVVNHSLKAVDSFYAINYSLLIEQAELRGIALENLINQKISTYNNLPFGNFVDSILSRYWIMGRLVGLNIAIPHLHHFDSAIQMSLPKIAYSFEERDYPIPCLNCPSGLIDKDGTESFLTYLITTGAPPWYYVNGNPLIYITSCSPKMHTDITNQCEVCPVSTVLPIDQGNANSFQHHEIELVHGKFDNGGVHVLDECYLPQIKTYDSYHPHIQAITPASYNDIGYMRLSKIDGIPYFERTELGLPFGESRIKKVEHPIYDREFFSYLTLNYLHDDNGPNTLKGDIASLCHLGTLFNGIGEDWCRHALAFGIYKIDRPGLHKLKPVYFAFPYARYFWFAGGPDMAIYYGVNGLASYCNSGRLDIFEENYTMGSEFTSIGPLVLNNLPNNSAMEVIATTDYATFYNYWKMPIVTIGIKTAYSLLPSSTTNAPGTNILEFEAITSPSGCSPNGNLIGELVLNSSEEYQTSIQLTQVVQAGQQVEVHVIAKYENGLEINECKTLTLLSNDPNDTFQYFDVWIRGSIKDYDANVTNYKVSVYH